VKAQLDWLLAAHCSPTLAGIKPACLVSCLQADYPDLPSRVAIYRQAFAVRDIRFELIEQSNQRYLLLVYHRRLVEQHLSASGVASFLETFGYPVTLEAQIERLKQRLEQPGDFPHEVGLFLGYPLEDVLGFVQHKGQDCKLCGYWKVYGDADAASQLFHRFTQVCCRVKWRIARGETLLHVFQVA